MRPNSVLYRWGVAAVLSILLVAGQSGLAQTRTVYAIKDARIHTVSGPTIAKGTVVIRNGLIEAVGESVTVPPEATVIDGSGLVVYPGLIDSFSDIGTTAAPQTNGPPASQQTPPKNTYESIHQTPLGLNANRIMADQVRPSGRNVDTARAAGITSALVVSRDGLITGQSVLINTGETNPVVKAPVALHVNAAPVRGGYPGTLMGAFAVLRQAVADANWYNEIWTRFNQSPRGMERPVYDPILEAMVPAVQLKVPAVFHANWTNEIKRNLRLAEELKLRPIIAGGMEAATVADLLKARDVPVLVSVNFSTQKPKPGFGGASEAVEFDQAELDVFMKNAALLARAGVKFALQSGFSERPQQFIENIRKAIENGLSEELALRATTLSAAQILGAGDALGSIEPGKIANLVLASGEPFAAATRVRTVFIDGKAYENAPETTSGAPTGAGTQPQAASPARAANGPKAIVKPGEYIKPGPKEVLIRNATVITVTKGTIPNGSVLIRDGKIAAVGTNLTAPSGALVIEAAGKYLMPGIIDAHSHMAIEGGGNEGTSAVTPNVRIADVIREDDITIYRALAGGVTAANILHGSANVIGGTNAVIKLKWGRPAEDLFFGAPLGIKFAMGENPKRSNVQMFTANRRWPATRMGVEQTLRESFTAARTYMKAWEAYDAAKARGENPPPLRRDLKLDTLADILRGKILVHAHSYVADEIVALLNVADEFGFKIKTLQHVLEGYKVADEIRKHGAAASTFADFWSYKWEAWDAIPQNASIMAKRGVNVSINSDSDERVRRLYADAAKMMHYGNSSEDEALRMITINPAIQLGVENRLGSIEVGKDADLAIFSAHPFSSYTVVEKTLIEGQIFFDREEDLKARPKGGTQ